MHDDEQRYIDRIAAAMVKQNEAFAAARETEMHAIAAARAAHDAEVNRARQEHDEEVHAAGVELFEQASDKFNALFGRAPSAVDPVNIEAMVAEAVDKRMTQVTASRGEAPRLADNHGPMTSAEIAERQRAQADAIRRMEMGASSILSTIADQAAE